jgi:hypothetical protein
MVYSTDQAVLIVCNQEQNVGSTTNVGGGNIAADYH